MIMGMNRFTGNAAWGMLVLLLCLAPAASGAPLQEQQEKKSDPAVAEGIALFDRGEYDKAIAKYAEALARYPRNAEALYEMAYAYHAKKDWAKTLELARKALDIPSDLKPVIYLLIGNTEDEQDHADEAIAAYRSGIAANPNVSLLHFNLGITLSSLKRWSEARAATQRALLLNPHHASSHLLLARLYAAEAYKVPALLAYFRFLLLEGPSPRAKQGCTALEALFRAGVSKNPSSGNVTVQIDPAWESRTDEGDFSTLEVAIPMLSLGGDLEREERKMDALTVAADRIVTTVGMLPGLPQAGGSQGFAMRFYVPFFTAMYKQGLGDTAAHLMLTESGLPGAAEWPQANLQKVAAYESWHKAYAWPAAPPKK